MQYISDYVSAALPRVLRTVRRNAGKITLVTISTAGAVALAYHIHKANTHITSTLSSERRAGAERLRAQFLATRPSLTAVFRAIYSTLLNTLQSHSLSNPDPYLELLRQKPSRDEKTVIWRDVLYASITRVCTCCLMASAVFVALSVEIELLARYAGQDAGDGVAAAPKAVSAETRGAFIDCVRDGAKGNVEGVLSKVRQNVEDVFGDIPLTKRVGMEDMGILIGEVLKGVDVAGFITGWFVEGGEDEAGQENEVVSFLKNETMDLFDVLEVEEVSAHAVNVCVKELTIVVQEGPLVSGLAGLVKECEKDLGDLLVKDTELTEFGACVFLSGERRR